MFWRGVVGYLPVNVVQGVVGLLAIVLFTRVLSPQQYGVYALAFTAMNLCHTLVFTWIEAAMARFYAREAGSARIADHFATLYRCWIGAALAFTLAVVGALALWTAQSPVKAALAVAMASVLGRSLVKMIQERRRAAGEVRAFAFLDIFLTAGGFAGALALIAVGLEAAGAVAGPGLIAVFALLLVLPGELRRMRGGRFEAARARAYAAYGVPIAASLVLVAALATTDRFLLAAYLNETAVGVYHAGYSLANRTLDVLFIWLGMASAPALIMALERGGEDALQAGARQQGSAMVALALPAAVGLALVARPLAEVMVGPALREGAAHVTPWIAASALFSGLTIYYLNPAFALARRTKLLLAAMAIPAVANIGLNLALIPRFGLDGAMWATAASYGLGMAASFVLGRRAISLPIPIEAMARAGVASLAMALVVMRLPSTGGVGELLLKAVCGGLTYGVVAIALDLGGSRARLAGALRSRRLRVAS
ncbi:MAG TPA: lipopolysaccharide biosynthesis protein [Caulobacteraceae bacterium]